MKRHLLQVAIVFCIVVLVGIVFTPSRSLAGILQAAYQIVQNAGAPLTLRNALNFKGSGVTCVDNAGTKVTDCTITAGTGGGTPGSTLFSSTSSTGPNNSAAETTLIGTVTGSTTIGGGTFLDGAVLEARGQGFFSLPAVSDSVTVKAKCGSTVLGSATFTPAPGVVTNGTFRFWLMISARGTGAGGAFMTNGLIELVGSSLSPTVSEVLNTSNVAFDFTTACAFDATAQFGGAQVGESMTGTNVAAWIPGAPVTSVNGATGAVTQQQIVDILGGALPGGTVGNAVRKNLSVNNGVTSDLLPTVTGSGYISELFVASTQYNTEIIVTVDAEGTPQVDANIADILGEHYADTQPAAWNRWIAVSNNGSNNVAGTLKIPIPFSSSVRVQAKNNSGGAAAVITSHIIYHTGITDSWINTQHLHLATANASGVTANTETDLVNVSSIKQGRLVGIGWLYDGFPGTANPRTAPLEGAFKIYLDGAVTANYATGGSEDFFGAPYYFKNIGSFGFGAATSTGAPQSSDISITIATSNTWGAQRFFISDPILFSNALRFSWTCGNTTAVAFTGTCTVISSIYYYTQN